MINGAENNLVGKVAGAAIAPSSRAAAPSGGASFADTLKSSIDEVSRLQQDASKAVEGLTTGKTDDVTGVMTAVEKSDLAFQTLLAIRSKLMEAYDEIKNIAV
ncbi:MAG TPA: flagellar hook-basal body complex protein FliE [Tepidisphaeraceae bacterium]|jgi:flagellar hook-basal body complex protein FliE|nr:flagellar hook-basal body complex protein FliE [Tepidisphaeraceae bacterium]